MLPSLRACPSVRVLRLCGSSAEASANAVSKFFALSGVGFDLCIGFNVKKQVGFEQILLELVAAGFYLAGVVLFVR